MTVAFWPNTQNIRTASFRLRCHQILQGMAQRGIDCHIYEKDKSAPRVLVLSKRYDKATIDHAISLRNRFRTKIVLDLCDNHFYSKTEETNAVKRANALRYAVNVVDCVVASTDELAKIVAFEAKGEVFIQVIGDAVEFPFNPILGQRIYHPIAELELLLMKKWFNNHSKVESKRLVWFGNHGNDYADGGMGDLIRVRNILEKLGQEIKISLTVISNSRKKYNQLISNWGIPTYYLPWNKVSISRALALHDISIIPIGINPFTICKTNNRVATSLLHGLAVVSDSIPSYREFSGTIELDDWHAGLIRYCENNDEKQKHISSGVKYIQKSFSNDAIVQQWINLFSQLS